MKTNVLNTKEVQRISYSYQGNRIEFRLGKNLMVNATEMAKPFNKRPVDWLRFNQSQEFLIALSKVRNHTLADNQPTNTYKSYYGGLVITQRGGVNPGTWMHEDVALEFARWLSPEFAIWCNDRIKEILLNNINGKTSFDEKEIYDYITAQLDAFLVNIRNYSKKLAKQYKFEYELMLPDAIYSCYWQEDKGLKHNIDNLLGLLTNNTASGVFQYYLAAKSEREARVLQKYLQGLSNDLYTKLDIRPN